MIYITHCKLTEPVAVIGTSTEVQEETASPKSTLKMFYCDAACEFTFVEGAMDPVAIKNYASERVLQSEATKPVLIGFSPTRYRTQLHIAITVESTKAMPYGIAVWATTTVYDSPSLTPMMSDGSENIRFLYVSHYNPERTNLVLN